MIKFVGLAWHIKSQYYFRDILGPTAYFSKPSFAMNSWVQAALGVLTSTGTAVMSSVTHSRQACSLDHRLQEIYNSNTKPGETKLSKGLLSSSSIPLTSPPLILSESQIKSHYCQNMWSYLGTHYLHRNNQINIFYHFLMFFIMNLLKLQVGNNLSLIHIWRCRRYSLCRSRWSPYH